MESNVRLVEAAPHEPAPGEVLRCAHCAKSEAALAQALAERDAALMDLAREREKANARFLSFAFVQPPPPPPFRHQLVDLLNGRFKTSLAPVHSRARWAAEWFLERTRGLK